MIEKLKKAVIKNKDNISYINLDANNKYKGWTSNFGIKLPDDEYMKLDLERENDLFLLFVLASSWSKTGQWENAAFFTTYLKYYDKNELDLWLDDDFANDEIQNRKENATKFTSICSGVKPRRKVSFRKDYFSSVRKLVEEWNNIRKSLKLSESELDYKIFINYVYNVKGLGAGENRMRIKIPLILRELRCQSVYKGIPGKYCCVPDARVKNAAKNLNIKLPYINSISKLLEASGVIYKHFGDLYDIPLFAYQDIKKYL